MKKPDKKNIRSKAKPNAAPRPVQFANLANVIGAQEDVGPILEFIELFKDLADPSAQHPSRLISIKVPVPLLTAFKFKAKHAGIPYQTMIKRLMTQWLKEHHPTPPPSGPD